MSAVHQLSKRRLTFSGLQIQHHALLVHIERLEEVAIVRAQKIGTHAACGIAAGFAVFNLDDLGAKIRQIQRTERTRTEVLEGEYAVPAERLAVHSGFRAASWRAMMIRCISLVPSPMHISGESRKKRSMS